MREDKRVVVGRAQGANELAIVIGVAVPLELAVNAPLCDLEQRFADHR